MEIYKKNLELLSKNHVYSKTWNTIPVELV